MPLRKQGLIKGGIMRIKKRNALILIIAFLFTTTQVSYQYFKKNNPPSLEQLVVTKQETNNLVNMNLPSSAYQDKITYLQEKYQNEEIKAIISIDDENFSYPVAQTTNNDYYLTHDYAKKSDALGAIYADYRVNLEGGQKILIFGHSSTIRQTPFNNLEKYYDEEYFKHHQKLTLETKENTNHYEIFSVYVETSDFTYMNLNFSSSLKWYAHLKGLQEKSWWKTDIELTESDDILILQTCSNYKKYQNNKNKYLLIVAKKIKK